MIRELPDISERSRDINRQLREASSRGSMTGRQVEEVIVEDRLYDNNYLLQDGSHGGISISKPNTSIMGVPGTEVSNATTIGDSARFTGVHFKKQVTVTSATATVIFIGCRFDTDDKHCVEVKNGTKVIFVGCVFTNTPESTVVSNNGGVPATPNVQAIGCSNKTSKNMGNVTETAVLT